VIPEVADPTLAEPDVRSTDEPLHQVLGKLGAVLRLIYVSGELKPCLKAWEMVIYYNYNCPNLAMNKQSSFCIRDYKNNLFLFITHKEEKN